MKKKKICLILNIITLCLCMGVIAVGVYSLRKSALNVGGSIGFVSHNLNVKYSGEVSNAINKDGTVYSNNITKETDLSNKWSLGEMYFNESTDYISLPYGEKFPKSIEVTIKIYNYSAFAIKANLVEDVNATKTKLEENGITMDFINNPYIAPAKTPDSVATIGEVKIIFTLVYNCIYIDENNTQYTDGRELLKNTVFDFGNVTINVEQTKNETTEIKYGEIEIVGTAGNPSTYNAYYVELGKHYKNDSNINVSAGDRAKWAIYKVVENGIEVQLNSLEDVGNYLVNNNGHYEAKENIKYYCVSQITPLVLYCNNMYYDTKEKINPESKEGILLSKNEYGQIWTDYPTSNIRNYLDGKTVKSRYDSTSKSEDSNGNLVMYPARDNRNFYDDYEICNDLLYSKAQIEMLTDFSGNYCVNIEQKFWVCSNDEIKNAVNLGVKGCQSLGVSTRTCDVDGAINRYTFENKEFISYYSYAPIHGYIPMISFAFMG